MNSNKGFTLIELIIVLAIIAIMAATMFPSLQAYRQRGNEQEREHHEYMLNKAVKQYYALTGRYPSLASGIDYNTTEYELTTDGESKIEQELVSKTGFRPDKSKYDFVYDPDNHSFTVIID